MPKLPVLSGKKLVKILSKIGFQHVRNKGDHAILNKFAEDGHKITIPVPLHKELAKGILRSIIRQADLDLENFFDLL